MTKTSNIPKTLIGSSTELSSSCQKKVEPLSYNNATTTKQNQFPEEATTLSSLHQEGLRCSCTLLTS